MSWRRLRRIMLALIVGFLLPVSIVVALTFNSGVPGDTEGVLARQRMQEQLMRWRKLDRQGALVAPRQGPWACVEDTRLNLIWEVKSWQEDFHYYKSSYSWRYQNKGEKDLGSCILGDRIVPCDTEDLVQRLNQVQYCGVSNWRLPSYDELESLTDPASVPGKPGINTYLFPRTAKGPYWTSTAEPGDELRIKTFNFYQGDGQALPPRVVAWARLVSSRDE